MSAQFFVRSRPWNLRDLPKGSQLVQNFLVQTAEGLVGGGKQVFAVSYLFLFELIAKFLICCI